MIKIGGPDSTRRSEAVRKTRKASASSATSSLFESLLDPAAEGGAAASGVSDAAPLSGLAALLGAQEVDDDSSSGHKKAHRQAHDLLDELDQLRDEILLGTLSGQRLRALAAMLDRPRPSFRDPRLTQILDEIELRARVELAKFETDSA